MTNSGDNSRRWILPLYTIAPKGDDSSIIVSANDDETYFLLFTNRACAERYIAAMTATDPEKEADAVELETLDMLIGMLKEARSAISGVIEDSPFRPETFTPLNVDRVIDTLVRSRRDRLG